MPKSDFKVDFQCQKSSESFWKTNSLEDITLEAHFFLSFLCTMKIEWLLFLKFLKFLAFFDSYFWPFNKSHEKTNVIFVLSAVMASIWNVFINFRWHDEKFRVVFIESMNHYHLLTSWIAHRCVLPKSCPVIKKNLSLYIKRIE